MKPSSTGVGTTASAAAAATSGRDRPADPHAAAADRRDSRAPSTLVGKIPEEGVGLVLLTVAHQAKLAIHLLEEAERLSGAMDPGARLNFSKPPPHA